MSFEDKVNMDLDGFFDNAIEVKYNPSTSANSTAYQKRIMAWFYESGDLDIQGENPIYDKLTIIVKSDDVPDPSYNDRFLIKNSSGIDKTWFMYAYLGGGPYNQTWTLELARSSRE